MFLFVLCFGVDFHDFYAVSTFYVRFHKSNSVLHVTEQSPFSK